MAKQNRGKLDDTLAAMFSNTLYRKDYLFYAHMIGMCSIKIDYNLPAYAGVAFNHDHYDLYINPTLFDTQNLVKRLGILKHEMLHILGNHVQRTEDRVMPDWNYATDCANNQQITDDHLYDGAITPKSLSEHAKIKVPLEQTSEFYYDLIHQELENQRDKNGKNDGSGEGGEGEGAEGTGNQGEKEFGEGEGGAKQHNHSTWEMSEGDADFQKDVNTKMMERARDETLKNAGTVPSSIDQWLKINSTKAEVNWKRELRRITGNKKTTKRPTIMRKDRRMPGRAELRGKTKDRTFELLLIGDVSGSMSDNALVTTTQEVRHICDVTRTGVHMIQIDTVAYEPEILTKNTNVFTRHGHGGTILFPAVQKAIDCGIHFDALVVMTDGDVFGKDIEDFKSLNKKIIWLIDPTGTIPDDLNSGKMKAIKLKGEYE